MVETCSIKYNKITIDTYVDNKSQTIDIIQAFTIIKIYENTQNKILSGTVELADEYNLFNVKQFYTGNSYLNMSFKDILTDDPYDYKFLIIGIPTINYDGNKSVITLNFTEENDPYFTNQYTRYLDKQLISEFVSDFSKKTLNKTIDVIEKTDKKMTTVIPYQKFHYMLQFLNWYAKSENGYFYYKYFTNSLKKTHFCTYSYLMKQDVIMKFREVLPKDTTLSINHFSKYTLFERWNQIESSLNLGLGGTKLTFDFDNKEVTSKEYKQEDLTKKTKILGKYSLYPKTYTNEKLQFAYYSDPNTYFYEMANTIDIINRSLFCVFGAEGAMGRTAGGMAHIEFRDNLDYSKEYNERLTGDWLCVGITHNFMKGAFKQELQFIKNGLNDQNKDLISV